MWRALVFIGLLCVAAFGAVWLADRPGTQLVAATDANAQGEAFAVRLREIADAAGCDWLRLKPPAEDWNDALRVNGLCRRR